MATKRPESEDLLRRRVTGKTPQLDPLLDSLLANAICVAGGWSEAMDLAEQHPGLTVVTASGYCCGPNGWRVRSGDNASTITALEDARDQVQVATARREAAEVEREVAESRQRDTQTRFSEALSHLEGNDDLLTRSADGIDKVQRQRRDLDSVSYTHLTLPTIYSV